MIDRQMNKKKRSPNDVHAGLVSALKNLKEQIEITPEDEKRILEKRAEELAKVFEVEDRGEFIEIIKFALADEMFGVEKEYAKEVLPLKDLTPLPCVPNFVLGIINIRGKILSVIDLKKIFEIPDTEITDLSRVIILKDGEIEFGILADNLLNVEKIYYRDIQKTLPTLKGIREEYLKGITNDRVVLLDYKKIINDEKIIVNEKV